MLEGAGAVAAPPEPDWPRAVAPAEAGAAPAAAAAGTEAVGAGAPERPWPYQVDSLSERTMVLVELDRFGEQPHIYVVRGNGKAVVIDTGCGTANLLDFLGTLPELEGLRLQVVNTHVHYDHIMGNASFCYDRGRKLRARCMGICQGARDRRFSEDWRETSLQRSVGAAIQDFCVTGWLEEGQRIYLDEAQPSDEECLEVLYTPGHTPDSISLYFPAENRLFTGDLVYPGSLYLFLPGSSLDDFERSLGMVLRLAADRPSGLALSCGHITPALPVERLQELAELLPEVRSRAAKPRVAQIPFRERVAQFRTRTFTLLCRLGDVAAERGASPRAGYADRRRSAAPVDAAPAEEAAERGASPRASYAERRRSAAPVEVAPAGPAAAAAADVVLKSRVDHLEKEQGVLAWRLGEVEQRVSKGLDSLKAEQSAAALQLQEADQRVEQRVFEDLGSLKAEQSAAALHLQEFEQRVLADVRSSLREQDESRASRLDGLGERAAKEARAAVELAVGQLERSLARDLELLREETCRKLDVMERRVAEDSLLLKRVAEEAQRVHKEPPELAGAGPAAPSKAGAGKPGASGLGREKPEPAREAGASDSSSAEVRAAPSGKRRIRRRHSERRSGSSDEAPSAEHKGRSRRHRVVESKATPQEKAREERTAGREEPDLTGPEAMQQLLEMRRAAASVTGGAAFRGGEEEHSDCDEPAAQGGAIHRAAARSAAAARAAQGPA
ncbi:unnamed protein product, partial [Prorocentrum cordatum]